MADIQWSLRTLWRWKWLLVALVLVSVAALGMKISFSEPVYRAELTLQITTPDRKEVQLLDQYRFASEQEEITLARNSLIEVVNSSEIYNQTITQLNLTGQDAAYTIEITPIQDTDFIHASVEAKNPDLAAKIINTHLDKAVNRFGELRAMTSTAAKDYFFDQLQLAEKDLRVAEAAFVDFRKTNRVSSLEDELKANQQILEELRFQRDQISAGNATRNTKFLQRAAASNLEQGQLSRDDSNESRTERDRLDTLLQDRQARVEQLVALEPEFNLWSTNVQEARKTYQHLLEKYTEASLKEGLAKAVSFVQVVNPAQPPLSPIDNTTQIFMLTIAGSLGVAILLAFLLEYFFGAGQRGNMPFQASTPKASLERIQYNGNFNVYHAQPLQTKPNAKYPPPLSRPEQLDPLDQNARN